ncbi:MAG: hypothetical protein ABIG29_03780 [Candidatus Nealsonbacteria bacterium]
MKKLFWGAMALLMIAFVLFGALPVLADDGDNFKKAGLQAFQEREELLSEKKAEITAWIQTITDDREVTKDEMSVFNDKVRDFERARIGADEYLKLYELKTSIELDEQLSEAAKGYFKHNALIKKDDGEEAKRYFAQATGRDVVVQNGIVVWDKDNIFFMSLAALLFLLMIYCSFYGSKGKRLIGLAVAFGLLFVATLLFLFLI